MEANSRKRKGFVKGKLMPLYKQYSGSKTKQSGLVGYVFHRDYTISQHKVSYLVQETTAGRDAAAATRDSLSQFDNQYEIVPDDSVDLKAANYISATLARFKLERVNIDRNVAPSGPQGDVMTY